MQKKGPGLVFAIFQSMASVIIGFAIAKWGKINTLKEGSFIVAGLLFLIIALILFYKYKLGDRINPGITNPKFRNLLTRYPLLPVVGAMVIGILIMVISLRILDAA